MNIFCFATDRLSILQAFIVFSFHAILGWTIPAKYYYLDVNIIRACSDNALSTTFKYNEWICFYIHFYSECYWILNKNVKIYQNEIWILILIILIYVIKFCKKKSVYLSLLWFYCLFTFPFVFQFTYEFLHY